MKSIFVLIDIALYSSLPEIAYKARLGLWQKITVLSEAFFLSRYGLSGLQLRLTCLPKKNPSFFSLCMISL